MLFEQGRRRNEHVVFTTNSSPSESLMNHSVGFSEHYNEYIYISSISRRIAHLIEAWNIVKFFITPGSRENPQHLLRGQDDYQVIQKWQQIE